MSGSNGRVSILDLTIGQVGEIERRVGLPLSRWGEAPSMAALYVAILSEATGKPAAEYEAMTLREVDALVSLSTEESDPTQPSALTT